MRKYIYHMRLDLDILADGMRRHMLAMLQLEQELCVCELEAALGVIQPVISRQLALLRDTGWVASRREGRRVYYRLATMPDWAQLLLRGLAEGGVPAKTLSASRARLARFEGRPVRLTKRAS
jgi:ArsR family transcriptional regulator